MTHFDVVTDGGLNLLGNSNPSLVPGGRKLAQRRGLTLTMAPTRRTSLESLKPPKTPYSSGKRNDTTRIGCLEDLLPFSLCSCLKRADVHYFSLFG